MSIQDRLTERKWKNDKEVILLPCPFCGCKTIKQEERSNQIKLACKECGCEPPFVGMLTIAVGLWNRRIQNG